MVRLSLEIKAELQNVTDLKPASEDFEYFFKVECTSCREVHPKLVTLNRTEQRNVSGGKHGTAHLIWRCSNCKRENSANILVVECRGLEFLEFDPRGQWICKGTQADAGSGSEKTFDDFNFEFQEGEWFDYDEKKVVSFELDPAECWNLSPCEGLKFETTVARSLFVNPRASAATLHYYPGGYTQYTHYKSTYGTNEVT